MNNVKQTDTWPASEGLASCHQRMVPGRIGAIELLAGCFTFWDCISLMAKDIARRGIADEMRSGIESGMSARQLLFELYGIHAPTPCISHNATPEAETRILRKWIGFAETDARRAARLLEDGRARVRPVKRKQQKMTRR